jgi:hypothetical protein
MVTQAGQARGSGCLEIGHQLRFQLCAWRQSTQGTVSYRRAGWRINVNVHHRGLPHALQQGIVNLRQFPQQLLFIDPGILVEAAW